jgi:aminopeptidase N
MRWTVCVSLLLIAGCGGDDGVELPTGPMTVEAVRYDYAIDLDTRRATSQVTLDVIEPGDCATLAFRATGLENVAFDGEPIDDGGLDAAKLTACGPGWDAGAQIVLSAELTVPEQTWGDSQVGFSTGDDIDDNPFTYMVSWVGGCDQFGPCDPSPGAFARYSFEVTHAPGAQLLCSGALTPGDTTSRCDFDLDGGPTYSAFGFAVNESWVATDLGDWGGVRATLYDAESTGVATRFGTDAPRAFLAWMADHFGPYPYGDELRFFTGPTYWSGFEHPGNISLNDRLGMFPSSYTRPLEHTTLHEIAHQWAGDQTTLADTYSFVWKEAMAEYLSFVFEEEDDFATGRATARAWRAFSRSSEYWPVPGEQPPLLDYYGDVYGPGPMILFRQIEARYDRATVFEALGSLLGQQRAIAIEDVQAALEAATGDDLAAYFDAWVYGDGDPTWPSVDVAVTDNGDGTVTVTADQVVAGDSYFGVTFPIRLTGDAKGDELDVWLDFGLAGAPTATAGATPGFAVTGWTVDPDAYSLVLENTAAAAPVSIPEPNPRNPWATR